MANTGNIIITERDDNPDSPTYGQTRTRTIQDTSYCQTGKNYKAKYTTSQKTGYIYCNGEELLMDSELPSSVITLEIGDCVTTIGEKLFYYSSTLKTVTMLNNVTRINDAAFNQCSNLSSVTLSKGMDRIGNYAFSGDKKLTSIVIPESVSYIGMNGFRGCTALTSVTCLAAMPPSIGSDVFTNTNNCPIFVPAESVDAYKAATYWNNYASRIQPIQS